MILKDCTAMLEEFYIFFACNMNYIRLYINNYISGYFSQ